ncbi:hypothetical protein H4R34_005419 [Dimargaris verticillata]|uniref:Thioredoxin domain-containing protein n=1 Tax=Dimargaris verticillata TaxID=2761393 RepID=A0A9W8B2E3_9FUNG|nr:hypothetical protein H4R34_005419 [Dimargaris verticillata]
MVAGAAALGGAREAKHATNAEEILTKNILTEEAKMNAIYSQDPYVLVFYENTCSNSARFMPKYDELIPDLKKKYSGIRFGDINCKLQEADKFCDEEMKVTAYPTPVIYQNGYVPMECIYYEEDGQLDECIAKFIKTRTPGNSTQPRGKLY